MKKVLTAFVAAFVLSACGGDALDDPMSYSDACMNIEKAITEKCPNIQEFRCADIISCGAETENVEKIDVQECVTNISNTNNCTAATKIFCAIACE